MEYRLTLLAELVEIKRPYRDVIAQLRGYPWDFDDEPLTLTAKHLERAIGLFLNADLSAQDLEGWANQIECREDLECDLVCKADISAVVFELANPAINTEITRESCLRMLEKLRACPHQ